MLRANVDIVSLPHQSSRIAAGQRTGRAVSTPCHAVPDARTAENADGAAAFESVRSRLFGVAFQVLGRAADAEDVVQDVWIRWQGTDRAGVRDPLAFLVTITTRVSLNVATSARARREISAGGSLPESDVASADPAARAEREEALGLAVRLLTERLTPVERAVFVLREAFDYPFRDIAETLELSEANARQVARRARVHLAEHRRNPVCRGERRDLLRAFLAAARAGEMAGLVDVLAGDTAALEKRGRTNAHALLAPAA